MNNDTRLDYSDMEAAHCYDCCCARSWKALGVDKYDGKSIPEHIEQLQDKIKQLKAKLDASQSSHKALETLYLQVRDEELVDAKAEAEKYRDTLYSAKMMDKDKEIQRLKDDIALYEVSIKVSGEWSKSKLAEIQRLKERLEVAEEVIHRNELTVYYRQSLKPKGQANEHTHGT